MQCSHFQPRFVTEIRWKFLRLCLCPLLSLPGEQIRTVGEQNLLRKVTTNAALDQIVSVAFHTEAVTTSHVAGWFISYL